MSTDTPRACTARASAAWRPSPCLRPLAFALALAAPGAASAQFPMQLSSDRQGVMGDRLMSSRYDRCPTPTAEQCLAPGFFDTACGRVARAENVDDPDSTCNVAAREAMEAALPEGPGRVVREQPSMVSIDGTLTPGDGVVLTHPLEVPSRPVRYVGEPDTYSRRLADRQANTSGATTRLYARRYAAQMAAWSDDGPVVKSCEEYTYELFGDYSRLQEELAARGPDQMATVRALFGPADNPLAVGTRALAGELPRAADGLVELPPLDTSRGRGAIGLEAVPLDALQGRAAALEPAVLAAREARGAEGWAWHAAMFDRAVAERTPIDAFARVDQLRTRLRHLLRQRADALGAITRIEAVDALRAGPTPDEQIRAERLVDAVVDEPRFAVSLDADVVGEVERRGVDWRTRNRWVERVPVLRFDRQTPVVNPPDDMLRQVQTERVRVERALAEVSPEIAVAPLFEQVVERRLRGDLRPSADAEAEVTAMARVDQRVAEIAAIDAELSQLAIQAHRAGCYDADPPIECRWSPSGLIDTLVAEHVGPMDQAYARCRREAPDDFSALRDLALSDIEGTALYARRDYTQSPFDMTLLYERSEEVRTQNLAIVEWVHPALEAAEAEAEARAAAAEANVLAVLGDGQGGVRAPGMTKSWAESTGNGKFGAGYDFELGWGLTGLEGGDPLDIGCALNLDAHSALAVEATAFGEELTPFFAEASADFDSIDVTVEIFDTAVYTESLEPVITYVQPLVGGALGKFGGEVAIPIVAGITVELSGVLMGSYGLGLRFDVGLQRDLDRCALEASASVGLVPRARLDAMASVAVNFHLFKAGAAGYLNLVDVKLPYGLNVDIGAADFDLQGAPHALYLEVTHGATLELELLKGWIQAFLDPVIGPTLSVPVFSWSGLSYVVSLYQGTLAEVDLMAYARLIAPDALD